MLACAHVTDVGCSMGLGGPLAQFLPGVLVAFGPYSPDVIAAKFLLHANGVH